MTNVHRVKFRRTPVRNDVDFIFCISAENQNRLAV